MGTKHQGTPRKKMLLSHIEKSLRSLPVVNSYYLKNYSKLRRNLFKAARLLPALKFPRYVHLLVTLDCNFSCTQCQVDARAREETQLTYDELTRVIQEIANAGVRHLIVTGGEPLLLSNIGGRNGNPPYHAGDQRLFGREVQKRAFRGEDRQSGHEYRRCGAEE